MSMPEEIIDALVREQIIPDIIPTKDYFTPSVLFSVIWPTGVEAVLGNELSRSSVLEEPNIRVTPLGVPDSKRKYTLVFTDPDAPSRAEPKYRHWRHWVTPGLQIPNVQPGAAEPSYATKTMPAVTPYRAPGPPPGSGLHRYTFLLFEEAVEGVVIPHGAVEYGATLEERRSWDAIQFAEKYGLKLVGANFFLCQAEE